MSEHFVVPDYLPKETAQDHVVDFALDLVTAANGGVNEEGYESATYPLVGHKYDFISPGVPTEGGFHESDVRAEVMFGCQQDAKQSLLVTVKKNGDVQLSSYDGATPSRKLDEQEIENLVKDLDEIKSSLAGDMQT